MPEVYARGQGGLLDVALSPGFAQDRLVYLSFAEPGDGGAGTAVARGRLGERGLEGTQVIWRQAPKVTGPNHWGSRIVFRPDGTLFVTLGDRYHYLERAQDLSTTLGKIVRINADGSVPRDNPFVGREGARPDIWSYGHRNVQAAALHSRGQLWTVEHGARGGDELNNPAAGQELRLADHHLRHRLLRAPASAWARPSRGWSSRSTTGIRSSRRRARPSTRATRSPTGRATCWSARCGPARWCASGSRTAAWSREERYLAELGERIRDVRQGPDGAIYLLTDSSRGRVLRVEPPSR